MNNEQQTVSRVITTNRPEDFTAAIAKLNKKAAKLKLEPLALKKLEERTEIVTVHDVERPEWTEDAESGASFLSTARQHFTTVHVFEITGKLPVLAGWILGASVELLEGDKAMIWKSPSDQLPVVPSCYSENNKHSCEHCNKIRNRRKSYLVYNVESKAWKQVGASCIKDFLGSSDILAMFEFISDIFIGAFEGDDSDFCGEGGGSGTGPKAHNRDAILHLAARLIIAQGYIKAEKDDYGQVLNHPTTQRVADLLSDKAPSDEPRYGGKKTQKEIWEETCRIASVEKTDEFVAEFRAFVPSMTGEFGDNVKTAMGDAVKTIGGRGISLLVGAMGFMVGSKRREAGIKSREEKKLLAGPAPEGRVTVKGEIKNIKEIVTDFGPSSKMTLELENGSGAYLTFPANFEANIGDVIEITATFTPANNDSKFAFGKRPSKAKVVKPAVLTA